MTTEVKEQMKQFQLFAPPVSKSYTENDDGTLTLEGIASTTNKDLQGDIILPSAIYSMKQQLLTTTKNLHGDHWYGLDGIYGAIKEVLDSDDNSLKIKATIRKSKAAEIKEMLDVGVNLGLSIGGKITEYSNLKDGWEIKDLKLMEISLTGMPANYDTYGTVKESKNQVDTVGAKCLAGACHIIRKDLNSNKVDDDGDDMAEENIQNEDKEIFTKDDAVELFNELMANKQEEIARETVNLVSKEIENIVKDEIDKVKEELSNNNSNEEETDERKEVPPKDDEEKEKALTNLINDTVKSAIDDSMNTLFKNLNNKREPSFNVDAINDKEMNKSDEVNEDTTLTSRKIAEKMFANQSKEQLITSLLQ